MDQITQGLIQEAYECSREVDRQIEELLFKRNGILADTQTKNSKKDELDEKIKQMKVKKEALWEYWLRLRKSTYRVQSG